MLSTNAWDIVCATLARNGVLYEDHPLWGRLMEYQNEISRAFMVFGLELMVDPGLGRAPGCAFVKQLEDLEDEDFGKFPVLLREFPFTAEQSRILFMLREELERYDLSADSAHACIRRESDLRRSCEEWGVMAKDQNAAKFIKDLHAHFERFETLGFVKRVGQNSLLGQRTEDAVDPNWEILSLVRARISLKLLHEARQKMEALAAGPNQGADAPNAQPAPQPPQAKTTPQAKPERRPSGMQQEEML